MSGPDSEKIKKKLQAIFKENDLDIVIECNKKIVDYLDITLNLNDSTFKPYHKPDSNLVCGMSNRPPNIIKQIPESIEKRLSDHSSNETIFIQAKAPYEKALKASGYEPSLTSIRPKIKLSQTIGNAKSFGSIRPTVRLSPRKSVTASCN